MSVIQGVPPDWLPDTHLQIVDWSEYIHDRGKSTFSVCKHGIAVWQLTYGGIYRNYGLNRCFI